MGDSDVHKSPREFESKERSPIWQYRATIPAAVDSITTVMDQVMKLVRRGNRVLRGERVGNRNGPARSVGECHRPCLEEDEQKTVQLSVSCHQDRESRWS
jgi:hypothetical protein